MKKRDRVRRIPAKDPQNRADPFSNEELLKTYLALPKDERHKRFADTARAAEMAGVSRRTIQFWIEIGAVRALSIGKRYEVDLDSLTQYLLRACCKEEHLESGEENLTA